MKPQTARVIQVDDVLYVDIWETAKPRSVLAVLTSDQCAANYKKLVEQWENSFKRFPIKEEAINQFKEISYTKIFETHKEGDNIFTEQLKLGIFIPVLNIQIKEFCVEPEGIHCNSGGYVKFAVLSCLSSEDNVDIDLLGIYQKHIRNHPRGKTSGLSFEYGIQVSAEAALSAMNELKTFVLSQSAERIKALENEAYARETANDYDKESIKQKDIQIEELNKLLNESKVLHAKSIKIYLIDLNEDGEPNTKIEDMVTYWKNVNVLLEKLTLK